MPWMIPFPLAGIGTIKDLLSYNKPKHDLFRQQIELENLNFINHFEDLKPMSWPTYYNAYSCVI